MKSVKKMDLKHQNLIDWRAKGEYLDLCGHSIFTITEGAANLPVILLIHGFPTSSYDWKPIWPALLKQHRLVCIDMLGFGFSDKPNNRNYSIHKQADLLDALVEKLNIDEFHVLAHDYGVSVAQELLARQLESAAKGQSIKGRWLSCTLLNGGLFPETHNATKMQKILLGPLGKLVSRFMSFAQFSRSLNLVFGKNTKASNIQMREFWELIHYNNGRHIFTNLITYINDRIEHRSRWLHSLQHSPIPIAVINGSSDPVSGRHLVKRYRELSCRLDHLTELGEIGHFPQIEAPKPVSNAFLSFIDSQ